MISYDHLIGREFIWGEQDCYGLIRDFYREQFQIDLPNYARPVDFWSKGLDLFADHYLEAGFEPLVRVHPSDWKFGDVIISAIQSSFGNHSSVLVENGRVLHHLYGQRSTVQNYKGLIRNTTVGIYRHKDVPQNPGPPTETRDIREFLSPTMRRRLDELNSNHPSPSGEADRGT